MVTTLSKPKQIISGKDSEGTVRDIRTDHEGDLEIAQPDLFTVFNDILKELKKINIQLELMTDNSVTNKDVEV